jgi:hypothetical protein
VLSWRRWKMRRALSVCHGPCSYSACTSPSRRGTVHKEIIKLTHFSQIKIAAILLKWLTHWIIISDFPTPPPSTLVVERLLAALHRGRRSVDCRDIESSAPARSHRAAAAKRRALAGSRRRVPGLATRRDSLRDGPRLLRDRPEQAGQGIDEANEVKVGGAPVRNRKPARR